MFDCFDYLHLSNLSNSLENNIKINTNTKFFICSQWIEFFRQDQKYTSCLV